MTAPDPRWEALRTAAQGLVGALSHWKITASVDGWARDTRAALSALPPVTTSETDREAQEWSICTSPFCKVTGPHAHNPKWPVLEVSDTPSPAPDREALVAEVAALRAEVERLAKSWLCYQCGERFTTEEAAKDHFTDWDEGPCCVDPVRADEKSRLQEVKDAREAEARWRREVEDANEDRALLRSFQSEIGRYFGTVGGVLASTPHQAWLRFEAEQGRAEAAEAALATERARALEEGGFEGHPPGVCLEHSRFRLEGAGLIDTEGPLSLCTGCGQLPPHAGCQAICAACTPPTGACYCAGCQVAGKASPSPVHTAPCVACKIEAEIGTEENPHPVPQRFHSCIPARALVASPPPAPAPQESKP